MHIEIPTFTRCCCCLPLRRGIIVLGYLSMIIAVFAIWLHLGIAENWSDVRTTVFRGASFPAQKWLPILLNSFEIVFIVILLVGAHARSTSLIRVYYYYGITTTAGALIVYLIMLPQRDQTFFSYYVVDICTMFTGLVTQVYLLLLIRSELLKPREMQRINHLAVV